MPRAAAETARPDLVDEVAEAMRDEYGAIDPARGAHIESHPYLELPPERKLKWRRMAQAAIDVVRENARVTDERIV